jgi:RimJ/RimL family protein N-acetyltransferase
LAVVGIPDENKLPSDDGVALTFFHLSDAASLCALDADAEHRQRFEFPDSFVPSLAHSDRVIRDWTHQRSEGGPFAFAVRALANGELLGGCEIRLLGQHVANLSYWTLPQHRSHGVASRAVALACRVALAYLDVQLVEIVADPDNIASCRVALRNGFARSGMRARQVLHVKNLTGPS